MNLYDKGYVWKMETPPANSNHLLEEEEEENEDDKEEEKEEEKIMAEDSEDSDSSLYQDTLSTHDPSTVSSSSSSPTSSSSSSSYSFLTAGRTSRRRDPLRPGGRGKDLRLLFAPAINLATHINVVLTPLQEMMNFEDPHHRLNRKDPPIFAGRTLLSSTFHVAVPWRPTTIAHLARYLEMKLYEEQGLRKEAPPPPESGSSSSIWPWPFALYVRTAVNEYQPAVRSLTMDDLRRGPEHHRHLAYEPAYHLITLYYTHARELLRAMRRSSSSPMKKKSKKRSKRSKEEKKKAKKEKKKAKKEKRKMKREEEKKKKAKKSRPKSAAFLPFTDGPSTSGAAAAAPPSLSFSSSSFSSSSSWSLGSD
ncbi:hypothetical protein TYRP_010301 [Tyrophagus putrescentiae]|nr:hypothetical protein TYRP_010301 [Tyrophagus putrescentiae]